jgi:hypothetical protein
MSAAEIPAMLRKYDTSMDDVEVAVPGYMSRVSDTLVKY